MGVVSLLATRNYLILNKTIIKKLGLEETILLGELASEHDFWASKGELDEDGYFFSTIENIEENTTLSVYKQKKALSKLTELGIVETKVKGLPAKRYFKVNEDKINVFLLNEDKEIDKVAEILKWF